LTNEPSEKGNRWSKCNHPRSAAAAEYRLADENVTDDDGRAVHDLVANEGV
jgi:hypothetical protein